MIIQKGDRKLLEDLLVVAAENGNLDMVKYLASSNNVDLNPGLKSATMANHFAVINWLIGHSESNLNVNNCLLIATKEGNIFLVRYFIENGASNYDQALVAAIEGKESHIIKILVRSGATNLDDAVIYATEHNDLDLIEFLIKFIQSKKNERKLEAAVDLVVNYAVRDQNIDIIELLLYLHVINERDYKEITKNIEKILKNGKLRELYKSYKKY